MLTPRDRPTVFTSASAAVLAHMKAYLVRNRPNIPKVHIILVDCDLHLLPGLESNQLIDAAHVNVLPP